MTDDFHRAGEVLAAVEKHLHDIRRDDWSRLDRSDNLAKSLRPLVAKLAKVLPKKRYIIDDIEKQLEGYESADRNDRRDRIERMIELIDDIVAPSIKDAREVATALEESVQWLKGVGPNIAKKLEKIGIRTMEDVLYALPREYEDRRRIERISKLEVGKKYNVIATVVMAGRAGWNKRHYEVHVQDGSGTLVAKWFKGVSWIEKKIKVGDRLLLYGEVRRWRSAREMHHPDVVALDPDEDPEGGGILPIYSSTEGVWQNTHRRMAAQVVERFADKVLDVAPRSVRMELGLMDLGEAFRSVHMPGEGADIDKLREKTSPAHRRLVFDEFLVLQVGLALKRRGAMKDPAWPVKASGDLARRVARSLPFKLTEAQGKVIRRILKEIKQPHPMNMLLQGDVGSGKTLVALMGALFAVEDGFQAAIMAPTEILAEQHARIFAHMLEPENIPVHLLLGKTKEKEKREIRERLSAGEPCVVVGTHAVIGEPVDFSKLAYAVVDEQHRFGVYQRMSLKAKGGERAPHTVVMTATPIPRTLAMTLYGDLDLAVLDEMPPGRSPVETFIKTEKGTKKMWEDIRRELAAGRQAFVVYPLVDESEKSELLDATNRAKFLADLYPEFRVGLVHGRMRAEEKEEVMLDFAVGRVHVLVATTVVEVGIDVPNATVMVVEHAERFGLSQLHQLRGRVGRGEHPGRCYLVGYYPMSEEAKRRLKTMTGTNDGFKIAEEDLAIRGPGEFLGARQSGMPDFRVSNVARDGQVLVDARDAAMRIIQSDPGLDAERHAVLKYTLGRLWKSRLALAGIG